MYSATMDSAQKAAKNTTILVVDLRRRRAAFNCDDLAIYSETASMDVKGKKINVRRIGW
jgi:hypothetical protein